MQNTPYQYLAKEFMELWQKQVSAVINDKQFIQAMLDMFQSTSANGPHEHKNDTATANPSSATDAGHGMLAELAFRLAMCEKRLSTLEQRSGKPKSQSKSRPRSKSGVRARPAGTGSKGRSKKPSK